MRFVVGVLIGVLLVAVASPGGGFLVERDEPISLEGLNAAVLIRQAAWYDGLVRAEQAAAEARAEAAARARRPAVTGSCAAMKPAGFSDAVIMRESGGNPEARNASSGAYGCAQILPEHFSPRGFGTGAPGSCVGLGYAECWAKLWAGGAGAAHWACTRESGCLR